MNQLHLSSVSDLLLACLLGCLGHLTAGWLLLLDALDDTDGDGLAHVTHGESAEWWVLGEGLDAHRLLRHHADHGCVAVLDALWLLLELLARAAVDLGLDLLELARDVRGMAVEDWAVAVGDLAGVVEHDDLRDEVLALLGGVLLGVAADEPTADVLDGDVLHVESDVHAWRGLWERLVVHLDGLDFGGEVGGGEGYDIARAEDAGLNAADRHSADSADLVDVLEGEAQRLVDWAHRCVEQVEGLEEGWALVPAHVGGALDHVVAHPAGDWHELHLLDVVADLLDVELDLLLDLLEAALLVVDGLVVHLVHRDDHLLDAEGEGEERVLAGLAVAADTGLELSGAGGDDEDGGVSLGGSRDHVLDEIAMSWGVDDGEDALGGFELPEGDVDGDTALALGLELVEDPGVFERGLAHFGGFLLELLDGALVDSTALVDEVASGG